MSLCAHCGRRLPLLHRALGNTRFCSKRHAELHAQELGQLALEAMDRLRPAEPRDAGALTEEAVGVAPAETDPSRTTEAEVPCEAPLMADQELVPSSMEPSGVLEREAVALAGTELGTRLPGMPRLQGSSPVLRAAAVGIPDAEPRRGASDRGSVAGPLPIWGRLDPRMPVVRRGESAPAALEAGPVEIPDPEALEVRLEPRSGARPLPPRRRLLGPAHRPTRTELIPAAVESLFPLAADGEAQSAALVLDVAAGALIASEKIAKPRVPVSSPALAGLLGLAPAQALEALRDFEPVSAAVGARAVECSLAAADVVEPEIPMRSFRWQSLGAMPPLSAYDGPAAESFGAPGAWGYRDRLSLRRLAADAAAVALELRGRTEARPLGGAPVGKIRVSELVCSAAPPAWRPGDLPVAALFVPKAMLAPIRPACCFGPMPSVADAGGRAPAAPVLPFRVDAKAGAQGSQPAKAQGRR